MNTFKAALTHNLVLLENLKAQKPDDTSIGGPITRLELERYLKVRNAINIVPSQFQEWLIHVNGLDMLWTKLYGISPFPESFDALEKYDLVKQYHGKYFPIGQDGGGNDYVVDLSRLDAYGDGPVLFADGGDGWKPSYIVASSIHQFIRFILLRNALEEDEESLWAFDKVYMLKEDPMIEQLGYPLPWEL